MSLSTFSIRMNILVRTQHLNVFAFAHPFVKASIWTMKTVIDRGELSPKETLMELHNRTFLSQLQSSPSSSLPKSSITDSDSVSPEPLLAAADVHLRFRDCGMASAMPVEQCALVQWQNCWNTCSTITITTSTHINTCAERQHYIQCRSPVHCNQGPGSRC